MGFSLSWLAIRGKSDDAVRREVGVIPTGERMEFPEAPLSALVLPGGWYAVVCRPFSEELSHDGWLKRLSAGCELVSCLVEEHEMTSRASGWSNGQELWSIVHQSSERPDHLVASGHLPSMFFTIYEAAKAEQLDDPDTDYLFSVPVEVAASQTGYYYDRDPPGDLAEPFAVLEFGLSDNQATPGFLDLVLKLEQRPPVSHPTPGQIEHAVRLMSPRGGPSFLILDGRENDYAQAAGGDGIFTVEWREYEGTAFRHWVAGNPGLAMPWSLTIPMYGSQVKVKTNEQLNAEDVNTLLLAFAEGKTRPKRYTWRDCTSLFL